jgi:predicted amidohydrolase
MKVTLVQTNSRDDKIANLEQTEGLLRAAIEDGRPDLVALPELITYLGGTAQGARASAEHLPGGPAHQMLQRIAREYRVHIHGGSLNEVDGTDLFNTTVAFDPDGREIARYRKIHMFDVVTPDGKVYRESATYTAGTEIVTYEIGGVRIGCAICYDIRFAELFVALARAGADVIIVPAAFTMMTGKDHWEVLLRARAIETQTYVLAPGQAGSYVEDGIERMNYGNSLVADPWGTVIARAQDGVGWVHAKLDFNYQRRIRADLPSNRNRVLGLGDSR